MSRAQGKWVEVRLSRATGQEPGCGAGLLLVFNVIPDLATQNQQPGRLLGMQNLGACPRPTESEVAFELRFLGDSMHTRESLDFTLKAGSHLVPSLTL